MVGLTSAAGLVGFLFEEEQALQVFALERLNEEIDIVWTEVSGAIGQMYVKLSTFVPRRRVLLKGLLASRSTLWRACDFLADLSRHPTEKRSMRILLSPIASSPRLYCLRPTTSFRSITSP